MLGRHFLFFLRTFFPLMLRERGFAEVNEHTRRCEALWERTLLAQLFEDLLRTHAAILRTAWVGPGKDEYRASVVISIERTAINDPDLDLGCLERRFLAAERFADGARNGVDQFDDLSVRDALRIAIDMNIRHKNTPSCRLLPEMTVTSLITKSSCGRRSYFASRARQRMRHASER